MTVAEIHLVPGDAQLSAGRVHLIPHGSYREPYAVFATDEPLPGRVLHFGRLEAYKGIPELLEAARGSNVEQLRIVGAPGDPEVAAAIRSAADTDARVTYLFGFVADGKLAHEISRSTLCVFPYRELHSSGAILVALSMNRPILVPRTPTTEALRREVGAEWVRIFDEFHATELDAAMEWASATAVGHGRPDLSDRTWQLTRERHTEVVRSVIGHWKRS